MHEQSIPLRDFIEEYPRKGLGHTPAGGGVKIRK
jgi:hypothetical protein